MECLLRILFCILANIFFFAFQWRFFFFTVLALGSLFGCFLDIILTFATEKNLLANTLVGHSRTIYVRRGIFCLFPVRKEKRKGAQGAKFTLLVIEA